VPPSQALQHHAPTLGSGHTTAVNQPTQMGTGGSTNIIIMEEDIIVSMFLASKLHFSGNYFVHVTWLRKSGMILHNFKQLSKKNLRCGNID
jgi:hypothetical protein